MSFLHKLRYIIVSVEGFAHLWKLYKSWGSFLIWITYICMHIVCWYMFVYILTLVFVLFVSEFLLLLLLLLLLLWLACLFASNSCIIFWPPFPASTCADSAALYRSSYRRPVWSAVNELKSIRDIYRLRKYIYIYKYTYVYTTLCSQAKSYSLRTLAWSRCCCSTTNLAFVARSMSLNLCRIDHSTMYINIVIPYIKLCI